LARGVPNDWASGIDVAIIALIAYTNKFYFFFFNIYIPEIRGGVLSVNLRGFSEWVLINPVLLQISWKLQNGGVTIKQAIKHL
jgi:hypothetical protein